MIQGMFDSGSLPVLERMVQFTSSRHKLLAHNIANASTPYFKPKDVDPKAFQATLREAIDRRRATDTPTSGRLPLRDSREMAFHRNRVELRPQQANQGILYHDENNRDMERLMQQVAENTLAHNAGIDMLRNQFQLLRTAIRERVA